MQLRTAREEPQHRNGFWACHSDVEEISELTEEQIDEIMAYRDELSEYSPLQWAFSNVYSAWEMEQEYEE